MAKNLKLLEPSVCEMFLERENEKGKNKEKCRYLHINTEFSRDDLESDIKAGAVQYQACTEFLDGPGSNMAIIICDTEEEGLKAVTYLAASRGFENGDDDLEDEVDEYCALDFDNSIPVIDIDEVLNYDMEEDRNFVEGPFSMHYNMEQKKADPYWTDYDGDVCIVDKCMVDEEGNIALYKHDQGRGFVYNPLDHKELWHNSFNRFMQTGCTVYYILVKDGSLKELFQEKKEIDVVENGEERIWMTYKQTFDEDFSLCSLILQYTAELVNINAKPAEKENYYNILFKNYLSDYGYTLEKRFPLRKLLKNICFMDDMPCRAIDRILKYIRHKYPDKRVLTKELFSETGVLKNVLEKAGENKKKNSDVVKIDDLVGMEDVKRQFENIIKSIKFSNERRRRGLPGLDYRNIFLLIGAPGTAKTTMANILGQRMKDEHLLGGTRFGSFSGAQLKGMFVGQTAPKVHQIFEDHDIIIIDEAYSLTASDNGGMDTYSQEALAQLAIELEDHGKDRLIFFAGYGGSDVTEKNNKMKDFLDSNPGIKSRINGTIVFPSYNALQMIDIVKGIAGRYGFVFEEDAMAPVYTYFEKRVGDNNFGNGREARSFVDNCQMTMAERIMEIPAAKQTKRMMQVITKKDVIDTVKKLSEADDSQYGRVVRYGFA